MSRATASTMITPTATVCQFALTPTTTSPLCTTCNSTMPTKPATTLPTPPNWLTPPITTPAITVSSQPLPIDVVPEAISAITSMPATADSPPVSMKQAIL